MNAFTHKKKAPGIIIGTAKSPRRSAAEWATIVADWKSSGLTAEAFARERGLSPNTLLWWSSQGPRRRMTSSGTRGAQSLDSSFAANAPAFVPLHIVQPAAPASAAPSPPRLRAEVILGGGRRVRVRGQLSLAEFVSLLDALEGGASC
jgi:hypothetical protein